MTKQLDFYLTFKTANLQDFKYATLDEDIIVIFHTFFSFVPTFFPDAQTRIMFNNSIKTSFTLSFVSWSTDGKTVASQLEHQVKMSSAQINVSPKDLIVAYQSAARVGVPNKTCRSS